MRRFAYLLPLLVAFAGCDKIGIETPATIAAKKEADGKAVGGACRNALRAIEDCYTLNPKANKAAVYAGWMEMDQYMRDNKLEGTPATIPRGGGAAASEAADGEMAAEKPADKAADKPAEKPAEKAAEKSKGH